MYEKRTYRDSMHSSNLVSFNVTEYESDLQFFADSNLEDMARVLVTKYRHEIENYSLINPSFKTSFAPLNTTMDAPNIVKHMCEASKKAQVGPMATVAGAISQYVGFQLSDFTQEIIVENGGDLFIKSHTQKKVLIFAGKSPFSNKLALLIPPSPDGIGICTSSGTFGHSTSLGKADAVVVISTDTLLADAAATSICNFIQSDTDIKEGLEFSQTIEGVDGVLIIVNDKLGAWGCVNLIKP